MSPLDVIDPAYRAPAEELMRFDCGARVLDKLIQPMGQGYDGCAWTLGAPFEIVDAPGDSRVAIVATAQPVPPKTPRPADAEWAVWLLPRDAVHVVEEGDPRAVRAHADRYGLRCLHAVTLCQPLFDGSKIVHLYAHLLWRSDGGPVPADARRAEFA